MRSEAINESNKQNPGKSGSREYLILHDGNYSNKPATTPPTARRLAALPLYLIAPLAVLEDALGVEVEEPLAAAAELLELVLAFAAAWKASKLFAAVGLTANTIPIWQ